MSEHATDVRGADYALCDKNSAADRRAANAASVQLDTRYTLWRLIDRPETADLSVELRELLGLPREEPLGRNDFKSSRVSEGRVQRGRPPTGQNIGVIMLLLHLFGRCIVCGDEVDDGTPLYCGEHVAPMEWAQHRKQLSRARRDHAELASIVRRDFNL